jgi:hypothetical protein
METKEFKPYKIHFDEQRHLRYLDDLIRFSGYVKDFANAFESFRDGNQIPAFEPSLIDRLVNYGWKHLEILIDQAAEKVDKPIRKSYLEHWYSELPKLREPYSKIIQWQNIQNHYPAEITQLDQLPWKNGLVEVDDQFKEKSQFYFETWIRTPEQEEFWNRYNELATAWNSFGDYVKERKIVIEPFHQIFKISEGGTHPRVEVNPEKVNYRKNP